MNVIEFGDCRGIMRKWAQQNVKVQTCITSPPYFGLRDYGHSKQIGLEQTPEEFIAALVEVFQCVRDILVDDGTLWVNIGDSYYNYRPGKGQVMPKQSVAKTKQDLPDVNPRRANRFDGIKEKDLMGIPWMLAFALRADGWYLRQDIIWHKPNPMPESVTDRCTKAHEYIFLFSKSKSYYFDCEAIKEPAKVSSAGIRFGGNKYGDNSDPKYATKSGNVSKEYEKANKRSVWSVATKPYRGAHFATFPTNLIEPCIFAGSRLNDIVLDPFMGSGTTAQVALENGRRYMGCELNNAYASLQHERITNLQTKIA
jgi:DNA modification methylase